MLLECIKAEITAEAGEIKDDECSDEDDEREVFFERCDRFFWHVEPEMCVAEWLKPLIRRFAPPSPTRGVVE